MDMCTHVHVHMSRFTLYVFEADTKRFKSTNHFAKKNVSFYAYKKTHVFYAVYTCTHARTMHVVGVQCKCELL